MAKKSKGVGAYQDKDASFLRRTDAQGFEQSNAGNSRDILDNVEKNQALNDGCAAPVRYGVDK